MSSATSHYKASTTPEKNPYKDTEEETGWKELLIRIFHLDATWQIPAIRAHILFDLDQLLKDRQSTVSMFFHILMKHYN